MYNLAYKEKDYSTSEPASSPSKSKMKTVYPKLNIGSQWDGDNSSDVDLNVKVGEEFKATVTLKAKNIGMRDTGNGKRMHYEFEVLNIHPKKSKSNDDKYTESKHNRMSAMTKGLKNASY